MMRRPNASSSARRMSSEIDVATPDKPKEIHFPKRRKKSPSKTASLRFIQRSIHMYMRRNPRRFLNLLVASLGAATVLSYCLFVVLRQRLAEPRKFLDSSSALAFQKAFDIVFTGIKSTPNTLTMPPPIDVEQLEEGLIHADYGNIELYFFQEEGAIRNIWWDEHDEETDFRHPDAPRDDDLPLYFAFDDDVKRDEFGRDETEHEARCRRVKDHRLSFPTCNTYHEISFIESQAKYLAAGAYRQVMVADHAYRNVKEKIILKDIHYDYEATQEHYEYVRMDAIVAERLTGSPRIYDIYGMCGLGILSEFFPHGDMEHIAMPDFDDEVKKGYDPKNKFTPIEKLVVSKQMAEALADLHGNKGGVIVHQDVQLSQFLWNADKTMVKLNDFNRAEFIFFDEHENEYCGYWEGRGQGSWRSAEEYFDKALTELVDVFSLGNNYFGVLTGIEPFHKEHMELDDEEEEEAVAKVQKNVKNGKKPKIDPAYRKHSFSEKKLAELIDWCLEYKPEDRPSMFQIVEFLGEALKMARAKGET